MKKAPIFVKGILAMTMALSLAIGAKAQGDSIKVTADIVSNYIWRGTVGNAYKGNTFSPNFQPTISYIHGPFEIGAWGSTDFAGTYKETDLYATLTLGTAAITINDYFFPDVSGLMSPTAPYFNYDNKKTGHMLELALSYKISDQVPFSILVATMFYGADKKYDFSKKAFDMDKQNYSTYIELGYAFKKFSAFVGMTPANGYYGASYGGYDTFGVVNMGITATRNLKISDKFELPLKGTIGFNPQSEMMYMVFGITL